MCHSCPPIRVKFTSTMARSAAIPPLLKDLNERTVLDAIRSGAPISRAEISRRAGISKPTVSLALQSLLEAGLVRETEPDPGRPTYGAIFFEVVPEAGLVLGLDLGARFLRGAICDLRGEIRARQDVELDGADAEGAIDAIAGLRISLAEASGLPADRIDGVVFGVPGVVDADTGRLTLATNVPGLEGRDWAGDLRERLGLTGDRRERHQPRRGRRALARAWRAGVEDFVFLSDRHRSRRGPRPARRAAPRPSRRRRRGRPRRGRARGGRSIRARRRCPRSPSGSSPRTAAARRCGPRTTRARSSPRRATRRRDRAEGRAGGGAPDRAPHRPDLRRDGHRARRPRRRHRRQRATCSSTRSGICSPAGYRIPLVSRCRASATPRC